MAAEEFKSARDFLLACGDDYALAKAKFAWPKLERFNWALDWFDAELASGAGGANTALRILGDGAGSWTFRELSQASSRLANGLRGLGARRGDRLVLMLAMSARCGSRCWRR